MNQQPHHNAGMRNGNASLTDDEVDMIRDLYEADRFKPRAERFWTWGRLAEKFEVSRRHIARITGYTARLPPE
jgi:AraC-like DNA-binding protein